MMRNAPTNPFTFGDLALDESFTDREDELRGAPRHAGSDQGESARRVLRSDEDAGEGAVRSGVGLPVPRLDHITSISSGSSTACATRRINAATSLYCWGANAGTGKVDFPGLIAPTLKPALITPL